jgi:hypothetical protein
MAPRELFAVGVRLFGVWLIARGATYAAGFIDGKLYPATEAIRASAGANLIYAMIDFSLAAFLLLWTRVIVAWSYGEGEGEAKGEVGSHASVAEREEPTV